MAKTDKKASKKTIKREIKREVGPGKPPIDKQFTSTNQPPPEAKKAGWEKKRAKDAIREAFDKFATLTFDELRQLAKKFQNEDYTDLNGRPLIVAEVKAVKYILNNKGDVDFMNRGVSYAKQEVEHSGEVNLNLRDILRSLDGATTGISGDQSPVE